MKKKSRNCILRLLQVWIMSVFDNGHFLYMFSGNCFLPKKYKAKLRSELATYHSFDEGKLISSHRKVREGFVFFPVLGLGKYAERLIA